MNLQVQLSERSKLLEEIAARFGEVGEDQVAVLNQLDITMPTKIDAWAEFLKTGIPAEIKNMKAKIQLYKDGVEKLEGFKEQKELYLNELCKEFGDLEGEEKRIVPDLSIRRKVDLARTDPATEGKYSFELSASAFALLKSLIGDNGLPLQSEMQALLADTAKYSCLVSDIEDANGNHPAIVSTIRQTVKILKAKKVLV